MITSPRAVSSLYVGEHEWMSQMEERLQNFEEEQISGENPLISMACSCPCPGSCVDGICSCPCRECRSARGTTRQVLLPSLLEKMNAVDLIM